jgi:hypothetical protein
MRKIYTSGLGMAIMALAFMFGSNNAQADSPRMTVWEHFTNASCPPCEALNPRVKPKVTERSDYIIPVGYRTSWPGVDPMYSANSSMYDTRVAYYGINSVPAGRVSGSTVSSFGTFESNPTVLETYKGMMSPIDISIERTADKINVSVVSSVDMDNVVLRVNLTENPIEYQSPPGSTSERVFNWVTREMFPNADGTPLNLVAGVEQSFSFDYSVANLWQQQNLEAVAFVQQNGSREILQGRAESTVDPQVVEVSIENPYLKTDPQMQTDFNINVNNPNDFPVTLTFEAGEVGLNGFEGDVTMSSVNVDANGTATVPAFMSVTGNVSGFASMSISSTASASGGQVVYSPNITVYNLSTASKNVYYFNSAANQTTQLTAFAIQNTPWLSETAFMAVSDEIYNAYPAENFEMAFFITDRAGSGFIGAFHADKVQDYIDQGKDVLMMSNLDLFFGTNAQSTNRNSAAQSLFSQIGITSNGRTQLVANNTLYRANFQGQTGSLFEGITFQNNATYSQQNPVYVSFVDQLTLSGQNAEPLFNYSTTQPVQYSGLAGVGSQVGDSKVMYLNFSFETLPQNTLQNLGDKIYEWFQGGDMAQGPSIASDISSMAFGTVALGTTKDIAVTVTNEGDENLVLEDPYINFYPDEFTIQNESSFPITLAAGESATITVTFNPTSTDIIADNMFMTTNDPNRSTFGVSLSGQGVEPGGGPSIVASASALDFQDVLVETTKTEEVTFQNPGSMELIITSFDFVDTDSPFSIVDAPNGNVTVQPNSSYTITVEFAPMVAGNYDNTMTVSSNDPNNATIEVALSGVGSTMDIRTIEENGFSVVAAPNVFSGSTTISMNVEPSVSGDIRLYMIDAAGNTVANIYEGNLVSGNFELNATGLASGKYFVVAENGNTRSAMYVIVE